MTYHGFNPQDDLLLVARKRPSEKQNQPDLVPASAGGFDIWWSKYFAQHTVAIAQASALIRAHRRANSAEDVRIAQAH